MGAVGRDPPASPSLERSSCCDGPVDPSVFAMNSSLPKGLLLLTAGGAYLELEKPVPALSPLRV